MNLIKGALSALGAVAIAASPALARVESGTSDLIQLLQSRGVNVLLNPTDCTKRHTVSGWYSVTRAKRTIAVCTRGVVDANDHDTIRHEAIHAVQHCVAARHGERGLKTIIRDKDKFVNFVTTYLTDDQIERIMAAYPRAVWDTELEAFAGSNALSAKQIGNMFIKYCGGTRA